MKIITPPQITGLDELLDVIIHPDKLVKTLKGLKDMRDQVTVSLDIYTTKGKAEDYLAQAQTAKDQADVILKDAKATIEKAYATAKKEAEVVNGHKAKLLAMETAQAQKTKDLKFLEQSLDARGKQLAQRADELDAQQTAITEATSILMRRQAAMDAEVDKMKQRIALFSDLH